MKSLGSFLEWLLTMATLLCGAALSVMLLGFVYGADVPLKRPLVILYVTILLLGIARYVSLVYFKIGTFK